ncbi:LacI family transcriptional regulator [Bacillus toyonensis]
MWVQERAAEILGFHRYVPASEKLNWVKEHGQHNGKMVAELALKKNKNGMKERKEKCSSNNNLYEQIQ